MRIQIQSLAWEPPYAMGVALKSKKKKKKIKKKERKGEIGIKYIISNTGKTDHGKSKRNKVLIFIIIICNYFFYSLT